MYGAHTQSCINVSQAQTMALLIVQHAVFEIKNLFCACTHRVHSLQKPCTRLNVHEFYMIIENIRKKHAPTGCTGPKTYAPGHRNVHMHRVQGASLISNTHMIVMFSLVLYSISSSTTSQTMCFTLTCQRVNRPTRGWSPTDQLSPP